MTSYDHEADLRASWEGNAEAWTIALLGVEAGALSTAPTLLTSERDAGGTAARATCDVR